MIDLKTRKELGFNIYQLKGIKQGWIFVLSYHPYFNTIREALVIRGRWLFIIKDYESCVRGYTEANRKNYLNKIWRSERINISNADEKDIQALIDTLKIKFLNTSQEYIRANLLNKAQILIDQAKCKHEFVEVGKNGYECENCHYYTGLNPELNSLIKRELERDFLQRQHGINN